MVQVALGWLDLSKLCGSPINVINSNCHKIGDLLGQKCFIESMPFFICNHWYMAYSSLEDSFLLLFVRNMVKILALKDFMVILNECF